MACSICGEEGHNSRTCSKKKVLTNKEERNQTLIFRVDNMTENEVELMHIKLVKLKKENTSNEAKATLVEGKSSELPSKIQAIIDNNNQLLPNKKKDNE
jgi:hypothetical protein